MRDTGLAAVVVLMLPLALPLSVAANTNYEAKVGLHVGPYVAKADLVCGSAPTTPCHQFKTAGLSTLGTLHHTYLVIARGDPVNGLAGISIGVESDPTLFVEWVLCADLDFPSSNWDKGNGGNRITWDASLNCQRTEVNQDGVHAVAGAFYVYTYGSPGEIRLVSNGQEIVLADCSAVESNLPGLPSLGIARFSPSGSEYGYNPCDTHAGFPSFIEIVAGNYQTATVLGVPLPVDPTVRVWTTGGRPGSYAMVNFSLFPGSGTIDPQVVEADVDGFASTRWTLTEPGPATLGVTVSGYDRVYLHAAADSAAVPVSRSTWGQLKKKY